MKPPYLKHGDAIALVATAKRFEPAQLDGAIEAIEAWGLKVKPGANLYAGDNQYAGTDEQRASDLQWALDDPGIRAVLFARGGYGTARIIDRIDWAAFAKRPKWLCGFSDLTVIHSHVHRNFDIETLHAAMPVFFADGRTTAGSASLRKALLGEHQGIQYPAHALNRNGVASGKIIGGNLSVLYSLTGTPSTMDFAGKILFLEDLTEYLYHLDRMMLQFKRSGQLAGLKGLIVGQFTEMIDNVIPFGKSPEEIILEAVAGYDYPVAFNAPIGHVDENEAVYCGRNVKLDVEETVRITF